VHAWSRQVRRHDDARGKCEATSYYVCRGLRAVLGADVAQSTIQLRVRGVRPQVSTVASFPTPVAPSSIADGRDLARHLQNQRTQLAAGLPRSCLIIQAYALAPAYPRAMQLKQREQQEVSLAGMPHRKVANHHRAEREVGS
jgi:hypothetical protein